MIKQCAPAGTVRLEADDQNGVPRIRYIMFQVLQNPAAGKHPARRQYDLAALLPDDLFSAAIILVDSYRLKHLRYFFVVYAYPIGAAQQKLACRRCHWAIKENGKAFGYAF